MSKSQNVNNTEEISVIIVEDDPMVRRINEGFINRVEGFKCTGSFGEIEETKKAISKEVPDLLLLDIFFIKGQGIELLKWLRFQEIDADVIFITADKSTESISEALRYGAIDYLIKPFRFERFEEALLKYKRISKELNKKKSMDQSVVDAFLKASDTKSNNIQPEDKKDKIKKEIEYDNRNQTYKRILSFLQENSGQSYTADMVGKKLGISRITARRYLDNMEKEGIIRLELEYGNIGRPQNNYIYKGE